MLNNSVKNHQTQVENKFRREIASDKRRTNQIDVLDASYTGSISRPFSSLALPMLKHAKNDTKISHICRTFRTIFRGFGKDTHVSTCDSLSNADPVLVSRDIIATIFDYEPSTKTIGQNTAIIVQLSIFIEKALRFEGEWIFVNIFVVCHRPDVGYHSRSCRTSWDVQRLMNA